MVERSSARQGGSERWVPTRYILGAAILFGCLFLLQGYETLKAAAALYGWGGSASGDKFLLVRGPIYLFWGIPFEKEREQALDALERDVKLGLQSDHDLWLFEMISAKQAPFQVLDSTVTTGAVGLVAIWLWSRWRRRRRTEGFWPTPTSAG